MAETIMRAIELAKKQLESPSHDYTVDFSMLKEICNDCNQLLNLPETDQIRLFCRQMKGRRIKCSFQ